MISILINSYNEDEVAKLLAIFKGAQNSYKCSTDCKKCEWRKPCRDISQAVKFLEEKYYSM